MILLLLMTALVTTPSEAGQDSDPTQLECYARAAIGSDGHNQRDMNVCAREAYDRAERSLQDQLKQVLEATQGHSQETKQLTSAQQSWVAYRTAWCRAVAWDQRGQEEWGQWYFGCLAELTRKRTTELEDLVLGQGY